MNLNWKPARLALEDGTVYEGRAFGAEGEREGEVVFNTSMTGYQEIITDPSYAGQIVVMSHGLLTENETNGKIFRPLHRMMDHTQLYR